MDLPWFKRDIIRPSTDFEREAVRHVQRVLRLQVTGDMDDVTRVSLRGVQHVFGLSVTGILDRPTAEEIENIRSYYSVEAPEGIERAVQVPEADAVPAQPEA